MTKQERLVVAMKAAQDADDAFSLATLRAGYRSRWDHGVSQDPTLMEVREAKYAADRAVHTLFVEMRNARKGAA